MDLSQRDFKAVIWDFGGVLTTSPFQAFNRYEAQHGLPKDFIRGINATNPDGNAWAQFESARIGLEEFDRLFEQESKAKGHAVPGRQVVELLSGRLRPRMVEALKRCNERFKTACITNNFSAGAHPTGAAAKAHRTEAVMALFDLVVESSVEGVRKPNPAIYQRTCERLAVAPQACVFLDDLGVNLKPARALGMHTIKVVDEDQALQDLQAATGIGFG